MNLPLHKALTMRASSIGDCLMGKYLLEQLHAQYPHALLGIVVASRGAMIRDLLAGYPWLRVIETNRRDPKGLLQLWKDFHNSDLVVTQYAGKHGGQFGLASKLAARVLARRGGMAGFIDVSPWNTFLYDQLLPVRPDEAVAEHERRMLRAMGRTVILPYPTLTYIKNASVLQKFGLKGGAYIVLHAFAGAKSRSISPEKTRELLLLLRQHLPEHIAIVLSGGPSDRIGAEDIARNIPKTVIVAGEVSLQDMMQVIDVSAGVVSVDTGIAHITAQLGKPLVVLRSCLGPNWWFPEQYGFDKLTTGGPNAVVHQFSREDMCHPHVSKEYSDCINEVSMGQVVQACLANIPLIQ